MKLSLRQLQVFHLVATHQSVSDAAKELNISQSAASMSLAQLEAMLDKPLFNRQGRRMELTTWGLWLRPHVYEMLNSCHAIEAGIKELDLVSGKISVGASQTPAEHLVPELFSVMVKHHPRLNIQLNVKNTEGVIEGLLDYDFDLGIIEGHCDSEKIDQKKWCEDELVVFASANHALTKQENVKLSQLEQAQWILREQGAGTREVFDSHIHKHIERINVHREYDQVSVILAMVAQGQYLGCLSYRSVQPFVDAGKLKILNVPTLSIRRHFSFIWRKLEFDNPSRSAIINTAIRLTNNHF